MTEKIHDQISAFIDDELSEQESAFLVRRLERDTDARHRAMRYMLIGNALRGELPVGHDVLRHRVQSALSGSISPVTAVASRAPATRQRPYVRPVVGFGIAAAVAVAAVIGLRALNQPVTATSAPLAVSNNNPTLPVGPPQWTEPASYVVPQDPQDVAGGPPTSPIRLTNYLMRHGEYASGLSRTSVHSNVVGAAESVDQAFYEPVEPQNGRTPQTSE